MLDSMWEGIGQKTKHGIKINIFEKKGDKSL